MTVTEYELCKREESAKQQRKHETRRRREQILFTADEKLGESEVRDILESTTVRSSYNLVLMIKNRAIACISTVTTSVPVQTCTMQYIKSARKYY